MENQQVLIFSGNEASCLHDRQKKPRKSFANISAVSSELHVGSPSFLLDD